MSEHPWRDRDRLVSLYWDEGLTQDAIADELGCTTATISKWMDKHDIRACKPGTRARIIHGVGER